MPLTEDEEKEGDRRERVLLCAVDWKDPECRKVISEFHKDGKESDIMDVDQDLDGFEKAWGDKGAAKFKSEYHKEGAPDLEQDGLGSYIPPPAKAGEPHERRDFSLNRDLDLGTVEVISYAMFRAIFGHGINIPIKHKGMIDLDLTVKGKDIHIDTKQFFFAVPDLVVWKFIYSHQGEPIIEFGRGVKHGMKVHRIMALKLGLSIWFQSRRANKLKLLADRTKRKEEAKK